jgi:putative CRISPR-associated protein (TIGR02619 family)
MDTDRTPTRLLIVSTCGTSLLTNGAPKELGTLLRKTANAKKENLTTETQSLIDNRISNRKAALGSATLDEARDLSAELNGLLGLYDEDLSRAKGDHHIFLHTDTYQGEAVAETLAHWSRGKGLISETLRIDRLNAARIDDFHEGMANLANWCANTLPGYRSSGYRIVFNLIGGFKSLQGFMQTLGMFHADESIYLFEGERTLLRIPRLPIDLDESAKKLMRENITLFRKISRSAVSASECAPIPETLLYRLGDECELSPWGRMLWDQFRAAAFEERLWPSPSPLIVYTDKFEKKAAALSEGKYRRYLNERLDDLARHLEGNLSQRANLNRLDLKPFRGNPCPPATHEIDAWAEGGAWRICGRFNGQTFILEDLLPHGF